MPQVSVIIPVYNIEAHLRRCLDSVTGQTLKDIEIICVDDGSTDNSPLILKEYAAREERFRVVTQPNRGPGAARNAGMALATGDYQIFLDSDDWFEPDFLEKMVARAKETGADIIICRAVEFDTRTDRELPSEWMLKTHCLSTDVFRPADIAAHIFQFTYGWPWDKLYRAEFVKENGLEYPPLPNSEDLVFVFQSLAAANRIALVSAPLVHHRVNQHNSVSNSRHKDPDAPYQALMLLREGLIRRGAYHCFEQSFLNWAMEFLVWNAANMGEVEAQRRYFHKLKREWLPDLSFESYPPQYYENRFTYCKYLLVKYAPWWVFSKILTVYRRRKEKAVHGRKPAASF